MAERCWAPPSPFSRSVSGCSCVSTQLNIFCVSGIFFLFCFYVSCFLFLSDQKAKTYPPPSPPPQDVVMSAADPWSDRETTLLPSSLYRRGVVGGIHLLLCQIWCAAASGSGGVNSLFNYANVCNYIYIFFFFFFEDCLIGCSPAATRAENKVGGGGEGGGVYFLATCNYIRFFFVCFFPNWEFILFLFFFIGQL